MNIIDFFNYIYQKKVNIGVQCILTLFTYILIKYKYKKPKNNLVLSNALKEKLIKNFEPEPIVKAAEPSITFEELKFNFSNYDVFNLARKYKNEIKAVVREYGIGSCGPRGFYGTLDIHLELEQKLAELFEKEEAILYSNYFTCVQSVLACYCKSRNSVFVSENASEAIKEGMILTRSQMYTFSSLDDLRKKLKPEIKDRYVVVERVAKNTGEILDLEKLLEIKKELGFRIIIDEAYSIPFLYQRPKDLGLYKEIDLIIGSLSLGYPTNGGFCIGCKDAMEYQRLSGAAYVFSASLPAFLAKAAICMLSEEIEYGKIKEKIRIARKYIPGVISDEKSPILLIECNDLKKAKNNLAKKGYAVGSCGEYIRICVNEESKEEDLKVVGEILKNK